MIARKIYHPLREMLMHKRECKSKLRQFLSYIPNTELHQNLIDTFCIYLRRSYLILIFPILSILLSINEIKIKVSIFYFCEKFIKYKHINFRIIIFTLVCRDVSLIYLIWRNLLIYISSLHC